VCSILSLPSHEIHSLRFSLRSSSLTDLLSSNLGEKAKELFLNSKVPVQDLAKIWFVLLLVSLSFRG
jgi:hypothetical protein